jgi:hypothetical protein
MEKEYFMKKSIARTLMASVIASLLALAGCDTPTNSETNNHTTSSLDGKTWISGPNAMKMWNVWEVGTNGSFTLTHYHSATKTEARGDHAYQIADGNISTTNHNGDPVNVSIGFAQDGKSFTLGGEYLGGSATYTLVEGGLDTDRLKGKNWLPSVSVPPTGMFNWYEFAANGGTYTQYHYMSGNPKHEMVTPVTKHYWVVGNVLTTSSNDTLAMNDENAALYTISFSNSDNTVVWAAFPSGDQATYKAYDFDAPPPDESEVIGYTSTAYSNAKSVLEEVPLGDLVSDALVWYINESDTTEAQSIENIDFAFFTGGDLVSSGGLNAGAITVDKAQAIIGGNTVRVFNITGAQIKQHILDYSSNLPQVSKELKYDIDFTTGVTVSNLKLNDVGITDGTTYRAASTRNLGSDSVDLTEKTKEIVSLYIKHLGTSQSNPLTLTGVGRIAITDPAIGYTAKAYSNTDKRSKEVPLGDLATDALAWYINNHVTAQTVAFAYTNGGGLETDGLPAGDITNRTARAIFKSDTIYIFDVTGAQIKSYFLNRRTDLIQVSSAVKYTLNLTDTENPVIASLTINGTEVDDSVTYRLASGVRATGYTNHSVVSDLKYNDVIPLYIKNGLSGQSSALHTYLDAIPPRITIVGGGNDSNEDGGHMH